jgi:hypothetical protein
MHRDHIKVALFQSDLTTFERHLKSLYASIPYNFFVKNEMYKHEGYYASVFYAYVKSLGAEVVGEDVTNKGRIDLTLKAPDAIFIFEFKSDGKDALEQIKMKKYHEKYLNENKDIYLVGIEFDVSERNVTKVEWEKIDKKTGTN